MQHLTLIKLFLNPTNNTFMQLVHGSTNRSCFCWHLVHGKLEEKDTPDLEAKISFDLISECLGLLLKCSALHSVRCILTSISATRCPLTYFVNYTIPGDEQI